MAKVNWDNILGQAIKAAVGVLQGAWPAVENGATTQIRNLVLTAQYVEENKDKMDKDEYRAILKSQKLAIQSVLLIYSDVGIALAEKAAEAAWDVVQKALISAVGVAAKIP